MTRTRRHRALAALAFALLIASAGCGRDKTSPQQEGVEPGAAAAGQAAEDGAVPAGLQAARAFIGSSKHELAAIVREVEAASGDKPRLEALGKRYRDWVAATDKRARALDGTMNAAERKTLEAEAEKAWGPLVDRLVKALQNAGVAPEAKPVRGPGSEEKGAAKTGGDAP